MELSRAQKVRLGAFLAAGFYEIAPRDVPETRAESWRAERFEKAEHVHEPRLNRLEWILIEVEHSLDEGLLGSRILGLHVYQWLTGVSMISLMIALGRFWRRRRMRSAKTGEASNLNSRSDATGRGVPPDNPPPRSLG